ncbi:hypothetical protein N0V85_004457 [Neurospora sp. IMI 360204]|nr:hypothetical protein N0V85_004457 [Neurospora sp. IMI 360204]
MSDHRIHMRHAHHHLERKGWDDVKSFWNNVFSPDQKSEGVTTRIAQTVTDESFWATATAEETIATKGPPVTASAAHATTTAHTTTHHSASTTLRALTTKASAPAVSSSPAELVTDEIRSTGTFELESTLALAEPTSKTLEAATSATAAPTATAASSTQKGTSSAATAGIAIGVLAGLLAVLLLVWFLFNKRKRQMEAEKQRLADDEKVNGPFSDKNEIKTPPAPRAAPQLSLRPESQFMPGGVPERRASRANMSNPSSNAPASPLNRPPGASAWERPTVSSTQTAGERPGTSASSNPFGDNQQIPEESSPVSPAGDSLVSPGAPEADAAAAGAVAGAAAGAAAGGLARKTSIRKDGPKPLDLTKPPPLPLNAHPPSPAGTEYSMNTVGPGLSPGPSASATAIAAAGGPAQSTVHRVQLDFKPTLEDELGLQSGQLVRLLHEYDDGWALCIRLDRSQQGVVPRTCLSARPVKPRPPQGGPGPRGPPVRPNYGSGGPGYGPMSPNYGPNGGPGYAPGPNHGPNGGPRGPGGPPRGPSHGGPHGGRPAPGPGPINTKFMDPRGPPPPGSWSRPQSPAGPMMPRNGPMSPNGGRMSPNGGHPASPGGNNPSSPVDRPITHGSQSPVAASRRMTPPGPSPIAQEYHPESRTASPAPPPPVSNETAPGQAY